MLVPLMLLVSDWLSSRHVLLVELLMFVRTSKMPTRPLVSESVLVDVFELIAMIVE